MSLFDDFLRANKGNKLTAAAQFAYGLAVHDPSDPFRRGYDRANALLSAREAADYDGIAFSDAEWETVGHFFDVAMRSAGQ
jgi:hypothetical protein